MTKKASALIQFPARFRGQTVKGFRAPHRIQPPKLSNESSKFSTSQTKFRSCNLVCAAPGNPKFHYKRNVWGAFCSFWPPRAPQEFPTSSQEHPPPHIGFRNSLLGCSWGAVGMLLGPLAVLLGSLGSLLAPLGVLLGFLGVNNNGSG